MRSRRTARWLTNTFRLLAFLDLVTAIIAPLRRQFTRHDVTVIPAFLLSPGYATAASALVLALMLRRRKRAAWRLTALLLVPYTIAVIAIMIMAPGTRVWINAVTLAINLALLGLVVVSRKAFVAKGDWTNPWLASGVLALGIAVATTIGATVVSWTNQLPNTHVGDSIIYTLLRFFYLGPASSALAVRPPRWVDLLINVCALAILVLFVRALFRSPRQYGVLAAADERRLRGLVDRFGANDSLSYFALRRDKRVEFSASGQGAVAYRVLGRVSLAAADPVGDPESAGSAIDVWLRQAADHAWVPAIVAADSRTVELMAARGFAALRFGSEAVVVLSPERALPPVDQSLSVTVGRFDSVAPMRMALLVSKARTWAPGEHERGFATALGRFGDDSDSQCVMVECDNSAGVPIGVACLVPWGSDGLTVDILHAAPGGGDDVRRAMIVAVARWCRTNGIRRISLGLRDEPKLETAGAGSLLDRLYRGAVGRILRRATRRYLYAGDLFQVTLEQRARYLIYRKRSELPQVLLATARAESIITRPRPGSVR